VIAKKVRRASQTCKTQDFLADCRGRVSPSMLRSHHGRLRCGQGWWTGLTQRGMMQSAGWGSAMRSAADGERNQQRLSTAEEALSPPGSSFQASHQDALIHLRPNTAPRFEHKRVYRNPCTKGIGVDPWAGRTAWVTALRRSPSCSVLRTAECTGVAFAQPGRISRSHRLRYRTLALVAAVLPGSWASLPIAGRRIEKVSGTNGTLVAVMSLALAGRCLFPCRPSEYKKKGRTVHLRARHGHRDHLRSLPVASRPTSVL